MTTTFIDRETNVSASWLNSVDAIITDPAITAIAGVTPAADTMPYFTGTAAAAVASLSNFARTLLDDADSTTARATLEAQKLDAELTAIAGLSSAADKLPYFNGVASAALADFTATGRAVVSCANVGAVLTLIGALGNVDPIIYSSIRLRDTGGQRILRFQQDTTDRWSVEANATAEGGANAGSDFNLKAYDDAGGLLYTILTIVRSTGLLTFTKGITISGGNLQVGAAAGSERGVFLMTDAEKRWGIVETSTAEGGSNAGTNFAINRYDDDGVVIDAPLAIVRSTGAVHVPKTFGFDAVIDDGNSGASDTIDFPSGQYHKSTMTAACAFTYNAPPYPCVVQHELTQDGTGGWTFSTTPALKWPGNYTANDKLLSTAAGARDLLILRWNGTDYVANLIKAIA